MLTEAINRLVKLGTEKIDISTVHCTNEFETKMISYPNGDVELLDFPLNPAKRDHVVYSLDGFVDLLLSDQFKEETGVVFVGEDKIVCDLAYKTHNRQLITVPLKFSDEFTALKKMEKGMGQTEAWRALHEIGDSIPTAQSVIMAISNVSIKSFSKSDSEVHDSGVQLQSSSEGFTLSFPGKGNQGTLTEEFPRDHTYIGTIWEAWDGDFSLQVQLVLNFPPLQFMFLPKRYGRALRDARLDMVAELRSKLPKDRFLVIEGYPKELFS